MNPTSITWVLDTPPTLEALTLAEGKEHLRISGTADDTLVTSIILAARHRLEDETGRQFITATWNAYYDRFPFSSGAYRGILTESVLRLPKSPVQMVNEITYVDPNGTTTTLSALRYQVDSFTTPARIAPAYGQVWPVTRVALNAVKVEFDAGYGDNPSDVPEPIRQAMRLLIGHYWENREAVAIGVIPAELPMAVTHLIAPYKIREYR